jgi:hypothetical protein
MRRKKKNKSEYILYRLHVENLANHDSLNLTEFSCLRLGGVIELKGT